MLPICQVRRSRAGIESLKSCLSRHRATPVAVKMGTCFYTQKLFPSLGPLKREMLV